MENPEFKFDRATYDVAETMAHLSIGRTTFYELVKKRRLTPLKIGKKTIITAAEIAALIATLRREAQDKAARRGA